jgi:hypothetical protein
MTWKKLIKIAILASICLVAGVYAFEMYFAQALGYANLLL